MTQEKYNEEAIRSLLNFDQDDLDTNREGRLSAKQRQDFVTSRDDWAFLFLLGILTYIVIVIFVVLYAGPQHTLNSLCGIVLFISCIELAAGVYAFRKWNNFRLDLVNSEIVTLQGRLILSRRIQKKSVRYAINIQGKMFRITSTVFRYLKSASSLHYKVYVTPYSNKILSIEPDE